MAQPLRKICPFAYVYVYMGWKIANISYYIIFYLTLPLRMTPMDVYWAFVRSMNIFIVHVFDSFELMEAGGCIAR